MYLSVCVGEQEPPRDPIWQTVKIIISHSKISPGLHSQQNDIHILYNSTCIVNHKAFISFYHASANVQKCQFKQKIARIYYSTEHIKIFIYACIIS